jgi:SAM-dependent methyltransferase
MLKAATKALLPQLVYTRVQRPYRHVADAVHLKRISRCIEHASRTPEWLGRRDLDRLQDRYEVRRGYGYDPDTLRRRGAQRASELMERLPNTSTRDFLEIGAHDAMVGTALTTQGHRVTASDLQDARDERAIAAGVAFVAADAAQLPLSDASFDVVYSYNTFEHVAEPDKGVDEALRVLRPGGFLYLEFGPLYFSPFGLHAYYYISVPYCQLLWPTEVLAAFLEEQGCPPLADYVNGWSVERYRGLWRNPGFKVLSYNERTELCGLALIEEFPSCFKKAPSIESLTVTRIEALVQENV